MVPASGGGGWFFWKKPKPKPGDDLEEKVNNLGRVFQTEISTRSGSVSGAVVHGNGGSTSISTSSGSISISIHPVGVSGTDPLSTLKTTAGSGSQNIRILSPSSVPGYRTTTSAIRALRASHTTTGSGSISAIYPEEWTGQLHVALRGSGSIQARGSGLQVQQQGRHELFGWKGDDAEHGASIDITEMGSGSVHFQC
ncbi:uncharacterized protein A1O9_05894 [Exophiala aquamarina CBS 119918]|uniref:Uncharacterized protein n=1 Tax=Exophiala aquamarina CBS 119918 TaxID=1182545 RepID=A0A072PDN0_9EURO|nr:uncharacterized protein A1O9_05894 [Exophiala aquamarina CBS 119918]KEF57971.1 hypothetical protein A1O9_05894 [Exophiala aquamarina CBS 119918]